MPKRTFQPNRRHRAKTHGFLTRMKTKAGAAGLNRHDADAARDHEMLDDFTRAVGRALRTKESQTGHFSTSQTRSNAVRAGEATSWQRRSARGDGRSRDTDGIAMDPGVRSSVGLNPLVNTRCCAPGPHSALHVVDDPVHAVDSPLSS